MPKPKKEGPAPTTGLGPNYWSPLSEVAEPSADPEERAVAADLMQHVAAVLAALPETYRSVFLLREVEGLSTEETANCLEVSAEVVKTRLHRARTMLRDALYRRAGAGLPGIFTFGAQRCDRVVAKVMEEIPGLLDGWVAGGSAMVAHRHGDQRRLQTYIAARHMQRPLLITHVT